ALRSGSAGIIRRPRSSGQGGTRSKAGGSFAAGSAAFRVRPPALEVAPGPVHRVLCRPALDHVARLFGSQFEPARPHAVGMGEADVAQSDGLLRRAAGRAGDPRDTEAEVRPKSSAYPVGHRFGDLGTDRAVLAYQVGRHTQLLNLCFV